MRERRQEHRRIGKPAADNDVGPRFESRDDRVRAELSIHADDWHTHIGKYAWLVHQWLVVRNLAGNVIALYASDLETLEAEFARNLDRALRRCAGVGRSHIGDDRGAGSAARRQQRLHAAAEMRIVASLRVGHSIAMGECYGALTQAFQHHDIEFAELDQIDSRIEPIRSEAGSGADAKRWGRSAHVAVLRRIRSVTP
jgi:hypothetical protein